MIYGYCRVSTKGQQKDGNSLEAQAKIILEKYANAEIKKEAYTGTTTDRPVFKEITESMVAGDTLVVAKLDRMARNTVEGIQIVKSLFEKGCAVHVLNVGLLENTAMGQFFLTTMLAVAELERNQIIERTQSGKSIAREQDGFKEGRPRTATTKTDMAVFLHREKSLSLSKAAEQAGISRSTLVRRLNELKLEEI